MRRYLFAAAMVLTGLWGLSSCKNKDESLENRWSERNYECSTVVFSQLLKDVQAERKKLSTLGKKLDAALLKQNCPLPKHPKCNIQVGIKGAATYFATGGYIIPDGTNQQDSTDMQGLPIDPESLKEAARLVKDSNCRTPVKDSCPTAALLANLTTLLGEVDDAVDKEEEIRAWYIRLGKMLPDNAPVKELRDSLKNLEEMLHDLTLREEFARQKGDGEAMKAYKSYHPEIIRSVTIDILGVAAQETAARLAFYDKPLKEMEKYLQEHKKEFLTKLRTKAKRLPSGTKLNMEQCLRRKDCWRFRTCVKRLHLPGLFIFNKNWKRTMR